jgi:hypothetical protein
MLPHHRSSRVVADHGQMFPIGVARLFRVEMRDYIQPSARKLALRRSLLRTQGLCVGVQRHLCC